MKTENTHVTIRISAMDCYKSLIEDTKDIAFDFSIDGECVTWRQHAPVIDTLLAAHRGIAINDGEDVLVKLQKHFKDGYTGVILPRSVMDLLDKCSETEATATIIIEGEGHSYKIDWEFIQW